MTSKNSMFTKAAAVAAGFAMALSAAAPAGAVTVADLQAQIAALMAQLSALQGGTTTTTTVTFSRDLTVGSSGADVTALQQILVSKGYLTMPAGVPFGTFGSLTKAAVARWQAAAGISPAAGYFGPMSRATLNASAGTTVGGTTTGGTTTGGTTSGGVSGTITTPGAEGTITVTQAPISNTTVYENDRMDGVIAFNVRATGSDVAVQRVKIDLGTNSNIYNKIFQTLYLVDDSGRTLASMDMNTTNVVKDSDTHYYATISGFSSIVSKGNQRTYTVKGDVRSSIDTTTVTGGTVTIPANGVRAVDGAGIDLYGPISSISQALVTAKSLASSATLTVSTDSSTPLAQQIVANGGSLNNQLDKAVLLTFDVKADKDDVKLTDVNNVTIASTGAATASTTYLFVGNGTSGQQLGSAAATASSTSFNNLSYMIPKGTTATFTIAADVRNAGATASTFTATINSGSVLGTNSVGDTVTGTGSATGNTITVTNTGIVFSLVGSPTISKSSIVSGQQSTSTATATFNLKVQAVGADIYLGDTGSTTGAIVKVDPSGSFTVYKDGAIALLPNVASSTVATFDSNFQSLTQNTYKLAQNNSGTITVTFTFKGADNTNAGIAFGNYAVGLNKLTYVSGGSLTSQTFMNGLTAWRTPTVVMP